MAVTLTALLGGMLLGQTVNILTSAPPLRRYFEYASNAAWPNARPGPADAIVYKRRGLIDDDEYYRIMKGYGYEEARADELYTASRRVVDAGELITLYRRGEITEATFISLMKEVGFEDREQAILLKATMFYPSPQDLIVWQAREVFEPKMIEKYGLDDEYELIEKAAFYKAGMDDEQIRNYWMAHWQHPGWTVVREMLHRTDLTEEDVYEWFKLVEIPPYWREKYTKIMYTPYTRVDVRRMYAAGIQGAWLHGGEGPEPRRLRRHHHPQTREGPHPSPNREGVRGGHPRPVYGDATPPGNGLRRAGGRLHPHPQGDSPRRRRPEIRD